VALKREFPFPDYPVGWFQVAYSDELKPGDVVPLEYWGQGLVLYRTDDGEAVLLDAYCPHLGAHLGYGGKIEGRDIRCPFHAWKFGTDGKCTEIPYGGTRISPKARVRAWTIHEINGLIMAWHHPHGASPHWEVPEIPECASDDWTDYELRRWRVRARNQEMGENAVDSAHFRFLHGTQNIPPSVARPEGHVLHVDAPTVAQNKYGNVEGLIEVKMHGFGFTTTRFTGIVETLLVNSVTPIDEEYVDVRFAFMVKKMSDRGTTETIGALYIAEIERQLEQDIPIWENKIYIKPPILSDGDGPIGKYRKWCQQFYAEESP
jgi:nitrite reductase/ring-hydroxylating ferredoxin subunit